MTYQQVRDTMSRKEKLVLFRCVDWMKTDEIGNISVCSLRNKILYKIAKLILRRDPWDRVKFYIGLLDEPGVDMDELKLEMTRLRIAYN